MGCLLSPVFRQAIITAPDQEQLPSVDYVEQEAVRLLRDISRIGQQERRSSFVSCWYANTGESEALWRLYCPSAMGVAILTDAQSLVEALGNNADIGLGRVQY